MVLDIGRELEDRCESSEGQVTAIVLVQLYRADS
jgi:hypothetical protein